METYYTVKQIAELIGVPQSTIRYWRDKYKLWVPYTGEGRKRRHPEEAIAVLRFISELSDKGKTAEETQEALNLEFPMVHTIFQETNRNTTATQQQRNIPALQGEFFTVLADRVDRFLNIFERNATAQERIADGLERLADTTSANDMQQELSELRDQMGQLTRSGSRTRPKIKTTSPVIAANRKKVVEMMKDLHKQGLSHRQIADHLNGEGIPTFSGRGAWQQGTVGKILKKGE